MIRLLQSAAIVAALLAPFVPAGADVSQLPIDSFSYPQSPSPAKVPVKLDNCVVYRTNSHIHVGFTFRNLELDTISAVKISVDLYDAFHNPLVTLDSTLNGTYSPNVSIDVPALPTPGDKMPSFRVYDDYPGAALGICYVSSVLYANGDVWNETARPDYKTAMADHNHDAIAAGHTAVAKDLNDQKALGYKMAVVEPVPLQVPSGWKEVTPGMYVDVRQPIRGLHLLSFTSLTGPGAAGAIKPTDIASVHNMNGVQVIAQRPTTVCGDRPAEYLEVRGTTTSGPQTIEAIKVHKGHVAYVSSYARSIDASPNADAEKALADLCF